MKEELLSNTIFLWGDPIAVLYVRLIIPIIQTAVIPFRFKEDSIFVHETGRKRAKPESLKM